MPPPEAPEPAPPAALDEATATGFRRIGERERLAGSFIRLVSGTFVGPDGYTFEREIVRHKGAVCIVPLEDDLDTVRCVRQYRAPLDEEVLELPAGKLDVPGEAREVAARRELAEEVGVAADRLLELGSFYNSPGFTDELTTCFLAEGLHEVGTSLQGVEEQHMTPERLRLSELYPLVASGALLDAKTIIGMFLARQAIEARRREA